MRVTAAGRRAFSTHAGGCSPKANFIGGRKVPGKYTRVVIKRSAFIVPSQPVSRKQSPSGPQWIHEAKFDGWRAQLHRVGDDIAIFTRKGNDCTNRFPSIRDPLLNLPLHSVIIDAEAVACGEDGKPDFSPDAKFYRRLVRLVL